MNKIFKLSLIIICCKSVFAQDLEAFQNERLNNIDSIINGYKDVQVKPVLSLLPDVGYNALDGSFNVGISVSNISTFFQRRNRNNIEIQQLRSNLIEKLEKEVEQIRLKILELENEESQQDLILKRFYMQVQLFEIQEGKKKAGEITTEDYIKSKLNIANSYITVLEGLRRVKMKAEELNQIMGTDEFTKNILMQISYHTQMGKNFGFLGQRPK